MISTLSALVSVSDAVQPFLRVDDLDEIEVSRLLTYQQRYSRRTVFRSVQRITERAVATFTQAGVTVQYPQPALHAEPRQLVPGADPVNAFGHLLNDVIARRAFDPGQVAVQLSGGMDSANVAMSLGELFPGQVTACGLRIPGAAGQQQKRRRTHLIAGARLKEDHQVAAITHAPLTLNGQRRKEPGRISPYEEPFNEAAGNLLDRLPPRIRTVFTGFGGDELMHANRPDCRGDPPTVDWPWLGPTTRRAVEGLNEDIAPASVIPETVLLSLGSNAPLMLRRQIWPVSPLAAPELVRFCEWLPHEWRAGKRLMRERVAGLGLPAEVARPRMRENLADIMDHALRTHFPAIVERWRDELILGDLEFVDPAELARTTKLAASRAAADQRVYAVLALELALRSLADYSNLTRIPVA